MLVRHILPQGLIAFGLVVAGTFASYAEYPDRPVKIIVAWPPGGVIDTTARLVGDQLAAHLGQPVIVENRVGANGNVGTTWVARAQPDGYTLQAVTAETHGINPHLYKSLTYDVFRDFDAVALLARSNFVLATRSGFPANDVQELVALAKASPGTVAMASYGIGSTSHVAMASFEDATQIRVLHVPHRGVGPAVNGLLTGEVDAAFVTPHIVIGLREAGNVKILGAASPRRMSIVPDVPTFTEQGIDGFVAGNWYGVVVPHGVPDAVTQRLSRELQKIAQSPAFLGQVRSLGVEADYRDAAGFAEFLTREDERWRALLKARNVEVP